MECIKNSIYQYDFRYNHDGYHKRYNRLNTMRIQYVSISRVMGQILILSYEKNVRI
jgi:hypothetical protein